MPCLPWRVGLCSGDAPCRDRRFCADEMRCPIALKEHLDLVREAYVARVSRLVARLEGVTEGGGSGAGCLRRLNGDGGRAADVNMTRVILR